MKARGPIDFFAALIVEFGGLALLVAVLPSLCWQPAGQRQWQGAAVATAAAYQPWPRNHNPTAWDDDVPQPRPHEARSHYVERRLADRGARLVDGLVRHVDGWLANR